MPPAVHPPASIPRPVGTAWARLRRVGRRRGLPLPLPVLLLALALPLLGACGELGYYWQAGMGQLELLGKRRPIAEVLDDATVGAETKARLRLVQAVQAFGTAALALPEDGHYTTYVALERPYVSWLVVAAPEFSLEAERFCYLIVGCLAYRGYFAEADARDFAAGLRAEGLDVAVRPVRAYSTLGWFDDPVLSSFLGGERTVLMGTILHEQAHHRYFLEGATAFNESFAVFVEVEGVHRYLAAQGAPGRRQIERYEAIRADRERFHALVLQGRERLATLYAQGLPPDALRTAKAAALAALREDYQSARSSFKLLNYDRWFAQPLNNAHLAGVAQYARHVGAFRALFAESGHDFARFYAAVEALGELPPARREARLDELRSKALALSGHSQ